MVEKIIEYKRSRSLGKWTKTFLIVSGLLEDTQLIEEVIGDEELTIHEFLLILGEHTNMSNVMFTRLINDDVALVCVGVVHEDVYKNDLQTRRVPVPRAPERQRGDGTRE